MAIMHLSKSPVGLATGLDGKNIDRLVVLVDSINNTPNAHPGLPFTFSDFQRFGVARIFGGQG
jgi:hypothetical protein